MISRLGAAPRGMLALLVLVLAVAGCFHDFTFSGVFRIADDTRAIHYPVLAGFFSQVRRGELPQWFPEILLGYPGAGSVEFHLFSPFHWAFLVCRPELAIALRFLSIHLLSALSMYALGRQLGMSRPAAVTSALAWALGPPAIYMLIEPMASATVPWFPLVLMCWDRAWRGRRSAWFVAGGLALGFALLGGHLQHVAWFLVLVGAYSGILLADAERATRRRQLGRMLIGAAAMAVVALGVAAVELLPSLELYRDSIRVTLDAGERLPREQPSWSETARLLPATVFTVEKPRFSLDYARVGLVPLALSLLAAGKKRRLDNRWLVIGVLFLLLALADTFPPSNWLIRALPGNRFRFAERIGLVFAFVTALSAGRGADRLLATVGRGPWRRLAVLAALALALAWPLASSPDERQRYEVIAGGTGLLALLFATLAASRRLRQAGLAIALVAMLTWSARGVEAIMARDDAVAVGVRPRTAPGAAAPAWLLGLPKADGHGPTRILCLACERGNEVFLTGHETPAGYVTLRPGRVERIVYGRRRVSEPEADLTAALGSRQPLLDLLGVRYVVVREPASEAWDGGSIPRSLVQVRAADGFAILENRTRLPRSFFTSRVVAVAGEDEAWQRVTAPGFDPHQEVVLEGQVDRRPAAPIPTSSSDVLVPARVMRHRGGDVEIVVEAPTPGFVVFLDRWAAGWTASVNGRPTPTLRADYVFQAVAVEAGRSVVRFAFRDEMLAAGAVLSALTLLGSLGLLLGAHLRKSR